MSAAAIDDPFAGQRERQASLEALAAAIHRAQDAGAIIRRAADGPRAARPACVVLYLETSGAAVLARLLDR